MITGYQEIECKVEGHKILLVIDSDRCNKDQDHEEYQTYFQIKSHKSDTYASIEALREGGGWDDDTDAEITIQTLERIADWAERNGYAGHVEPDSTMAAMIQSDKDSIESSNKQARINKDREWFGRDFDPNNYDGA